MSSLNKVSIIGNLAADPELKYTPNSRALCNLRIATSESYKDKDGVKHEKTEWHRVTLWQNKAENAAKFLAKGRQVYVEGKLQTRSYDKDGQKHFITEIVANTIIFLGGGRAKGDTVEEGTRIENDDEEVRQQQTVAGMEVPV